MLYSRQLHDMQGLSLPMLPQEASQGERCPDDISRTGIPHRTCMASTRPKPCRLAGLICTAALLSRHVSAVTSKAVPASGLTPERTTNVMENASIAPPPAASARDTSAPSYTIAVMFGHNSGGNAPGTSSSG